jgi:hypothetical protein
VLDGHEKGVPTTLPQPPNGLPISRRERTTANLLKPNDLAREAVGCMGVFGRWSRVPFCRPHTRTTSAHDHASTTGVVWNHILHPITRGTTSKQHHGRSYHASTTGARTTEGGQPALAPATRYARKRDCQPPCPSGRTDWHSAAASALHRVTLKPNDLAREAVSCNAGLDGRLD